MSEKTLCTNCNAEILQTTANKTGGLCMPCKNGYREHIEQAKEYYKKERELDKTCPFRAFWRKLVDRVYKTDEGFNNLNKYEKTYYTVNVLFGEVFNGGFDQYFSNSAGEHYEYAYQGLKELNAIKSLEILQKAKLEFFAEKNVPTDRIERWNLMNKNPSEVIIDSIESIFWDDPDNLGDKLEEFAIKNKLITDI